jgi:hypothetical protein
LSDVSIQEGRKISEKRARRYLKDEIRETIQERKSSAAENIREKRADEWAMAIMRDCEDAEVHKETLVFFERERIMEELEDSLGDQLKAEVTSRAKAMFRV